MSARAFASQGKHTHMVDRYALLSQLFHLSRRNDPPRGLITRNVRRSVEVFHDHLAKQAGSSNNSDNQQQQQNTDGPASGAANSTAPATAIEPFAPAITRECSFPYKPSPAALQHIVSVWGVSPGQVLMVGDSVKDDIVSTATCTTKYTAWCTAWHTVRTAVHGHGEQFARV